jgi:hypothetical protein
MSDDTISVTEWLADLKAVDYAARMYLKAEQEHAAGTGRRFSVDYWKAELIKAVEGDA